MKYINISRIGMKTRNLTPVAIIGEGRLILNGYEKQTGWHTPGTFAQSISFYEYDWVTDALRKVDLGGLDTFVLHISRTVSKIGMHYFLVSKSKDRIGIVKCNFLNHTYEYISLDFFDKIDVFNIKIHLIDLTPNNFAIKLYNNSKCEIYVYDHPTQKAYRILYYENDDMRYSDIGYIEVENKSYILFMKYGMPNCKMEFFIHNTEWDEETKRYKDEKMFLFPLDDLLISKGIYLNEDYLITQAGASNTLRFIKDFGDSIYYTKRDLNIHIEGSTYKHELLQYSITENRVTQSFEYKWDALASSNGLFSYEAYNEYILLNSFFDSKQYQLPYKNAFVQNIYNEHVLLESIEEATLSNGYPSTCLVIYNLKEEREVDRFYSKDYKLRQLPFPTSTSLKYKYFDGHDMLVLY